MNVSFPESVLKMSNNNSNNKNCINDAPYSYKNINHRGEGSPVDDDYIQIIGTKPASNYQIYPIGRDFFSKIRLVIFFVYFFHALNYFLSKDILQKDYFLFIECQPNWNPEHYPEHNWRSQEGSSDTKDFCGKQQSSFHPQKIYIDC